MKRKRKKDLLAFVKRLLIVAHRPLLSSRSHLSSRHITVLFSCRLERTTKSGNEAGNGTTETGIGIHGEVGAVDLTGVKVEGDLVGHVVRTVLTEIWIETDEAGLSLNLNYIFVLINLIDKRDRDYRRDRPDDRRGDPRGDRERDRRGDDRRRDRGDDRREPPRRDDRDGTAREDRKLREYESKGNAPSKSESGPVGEE